LYNNTSPPSYAPRQDVDPSITPKGHSRHTRLYRSPSPEQPRLLRDADTRNQSTVVPRRRGRDHDMDLMPSDETEAKRRRLGDKGDPPRRISPSTYPAHHVSVPEDVPLPPLSPTQLEPTRTYSPAHAQFRFDIFTLWVSEFSSQLCRPQESTASSAKRSVSILEVQPK
jgi:hypothetical protein